MVKFHTDIGNRYGQISYRNGKSIWSIEMIKAYIGMVNTYGPTS